jgi:dTDP-4-amino-4,6-dideoxygalactose transaminase
MEIPALVAAALVVIGPPALAAAMWVRRRHPGADAAEIAAAAYGGVGIAALALWLAAVFLFGQAADMDPILATADKYGMKVIEDVAQAFGGRYKGRMLGALGAAAAFSFPSKNLAAFGDAGLISTDDDHIAEISRMLRTHGSKKKYFNETLGYNSRLDELQAAALRVKLPHVEQWNASRRV